LRKIRSCGAFGFQDNFQSTILVQVGKRKRAAILKKIQSNCS